MKASLVVGEHALAIVHEKREVPQKADAQGLVESIAVEVPVLVIRTGEFDLGFVMKIRTRGEARALAAALDVLAELLPVTGDEDR